MQKITSHATAICLGNKGYLLKGSSGAGKSDLAFRLITNYPSKAKIIADDQVIIECKNERVILSAPSPIKGLIEVRGVGIINVDIQENIELFSIIYLVPWDRIERFPDNKYETIFGVDFPVYYIDPFEVSSLDKVMLISSLN